MELLLPAKTRVQRTSAGSLVMLRRAYFRTASMASCSSDERTLKSLSLLFFREGCTRFVSSTTTKSWFGSTQKYVPVKPVWP